MLTTLLLLALAIGIVVWMATTPASSQHDLGDATLRATVELHAIRRQLDVARLKSEAKSDALRLRRALREELRDGWDPSDRSGW